MKLHKSLIQNSVLRNSLIVANSVELLSIINKSSPYTATIEIKFLVLLKNKEQSLREVVQSLKLSAPVSLVYYCLEDFSEHIGIFFKCTNIVRMGRAGGYNSWHVNFFLKLSTKKSIINIKLGDKPLIFTAMAIRHLIIVILTTGKKISL